MPLFLSLMIFLWCVPRSYWRGPSWQEVFIEKAMRYNATTRTPWPIEGERIQEKTRCRTAAPPKNAKKDEKRHYKQMLHRLLHKRPTKNSKIPISPLHAQKSSGSRLGSLSFSLGICAAVFGAFAFFIFFLIAFVLQLFSIGNFKGSRAITTFVAIFPSSFQWQEHKYGCNIWSCHLSFKFNTVSGIELRYSLLYLPVFRYACCSLVYFNLQLIWWSCSCLFSSCHILCKLACSGWGL